MKPREFYDIMIKFVEEDKRWRALQVGSIIYESVARGGEMDYHKMEILEIDLEEREVKAKDVSGNHIATLSGFLTEEEFMNSNIRY